MTPDPLNRLVASLAKLPGIGEKTAQRLAFHILRAPPEYARVLSTSIQEVKDKVHLCAHCFSLTEQDLCGFCRDDRRDERVVCVVENVADQMAIERTREFKGRYHVLHGVISPVEGVGPEDLKIRELVARLTREPIKEVILATNISLEGEATAMYLQKQLAASGVRVTRLARGLPVGADLEYADETTLARAFQGRSEM